MTFKKIFYPSILGLLAPLLTPQLLTTQLCASTPASAESIRLAHKDHRDSCPTHLNVELPILHSKQTANLCQLTKDAKAYLIVNTASYCGYTPQFKALESLYKKYKGQGFTILGFPSNDFNQEDASEAKTADICFKNYGVSFTMFQPTSVRGDKALPLFGYLAKKTNAPQWNFNKYLVSGESVTFYSSTEKPLDSKLESDIKVALGPTE